MRRERVLDLLQKNGFLLVLLTLVPLLLAAVTSHAGKALGNMTPWEPAKIPFLIGFAAILAVLYKNLARTYWGMPRARDVLPLIVMAVLPFVPFFVLKDFGQMMVFSAVYATLYLIAVRRFSQRFVFIGSVLLVAWGFDRRSASGLILRKKYLCSRHSPVRSKKYFRTEFNSAFICGWTVLIRQRQKRRGGRSDYDEYYKRLIEKKPETPENDRGRSRPAKRDKYRCVV